MLGLTNLDLKNSVLNLTEKLKILQSLTNHCWSDSETMKRIKYLSTLRSLYDLELFVKCIREKGIIIEMGEESYISSDLDNCSLGNDLLEALKTYKYNGLEDMALKMKLKISEHAKCLDIKYVGSDLQVSGLPPGI